MYTDLVCTNQACATVREDVWLHQTDINQRNFPNCLECGAEMTWLPIARRSSKTPYINGAWPPVFINSMED